MRTRYVTTDLELESASDLEPIAAHFGEDVSLHFVGKVGDLYRAAFGLGGEYSGEDEEIGFFCTLAESLDDAAKAVWASCTKIHFNMGYEAGVTPKSWESRISAETLERVADLEGDLIVTIYPAGTYGPGESVSDP